MKKKSSELSPLAKGIQDYLQDFADENFFGTRKALNIEVVTYLHKSEEFANDLKSVREKLNIPLLLPERDVVEYEATQWDIEAYSAWLSANKKIRAFERELDQLFTKYILPKNFHDWLEWYILYRTKPPWTPNYNWDMLEQILKDKNETKRIPLTTKEKKFARWQFRYLTKSKKGRPSKKYANAYQELLQALAQSKNTARRSRTLNQAIKTIKKGTVETYYDPVEEKIISERPTYKKLAVKIKKDASEQERDKLASTLRKQNQRVKARMSRNIKVEK